MSTYIRIYSNPPARFISIKLYPDFRVPEHSTREIIAPLLRGATLNLPIQILCMENGDNSISTRNYFNP